MFRPILLAWAIVLATVTASFSFDQRFIGRFYDGNKLLERCEGAPSIAEGYIMGIVDGSQYAAEWSAGYHGYRYCSPQGATSRQYRDLACDYVKNHPESRQMTASTLVLEALYSAWPCPGIQ